LRHLLIKQSGYPEKSAPIAKERFGRDLTSNIFWMGRISSLLMKIIIITKQITQKVFKVKSCSTTKYGTLKKRKPKKNNKKQNRNL